MSTVAPVAGVIEIVRSDGVEQPLREAAKSKADRVKTLDLEHSRRTPTRVTSLFGHAPTADISALPTPGLAPKLCRVLGQLRNTRIRNGNLKSD